MKMSDATRLALVGFVAVLAFAGCSSNGDQTAAETRAATTAAAIPSATNLVSTPTLAPVGRVASVNAQARFVVLNYPVGRVPARESRLNVYHDGIKTGELKVTGPERDNLTVADITAGSAQEGDEVRPD